MEIPPKLILALSISGMLALLILAAWFGSKRKRRRKWKDDMPIWIDTSSHSDDRRGFFSDWFDSDGGGDFGGDAGGDGGGD